MPQAATPAGPDFPAGWLAGGAPATGNGPPPAGRSAPPLLSRLRPADSQAAQPLLAQLGLPAPVPQPVAHPAALPPLLAALSSATPAGMAHQTPPLLEMFRNPGQPAAPSPAPPAGDVLRALRLQGRS
ncbi:hypothetical protein [Teichococcus oryzae]|uniref:Uncharacterized protein n=1 Tax=Teichococcus oryzae TaxID=1608942 RepID=A0A5B2TIY9_9PROT|nr:hypothetical protein [Pseudoroseomonas oryzae]KAA2214446.1 hypothetical protein F0Q34_01600 [Pseudoroseomonas oryzae]